MQQAAGANNACFTFPVMTNFQLILLQTTFTVTSDKQASPPCCSLTSKNAHDFIQM